MEHLYSFDRNSNHVKFFKWLWGVNPTTRYKTMCPYFWAYLGSILILPLILIVKAINYIAKPIIKWYDAYSEGQVDKYFKDIAKLVNSGSYTDYDLYKIYKSKCFSNHYYNYLGREGFNRDIYDKIDKTYDKYVDLSYKKKMKIQKTMDNLKYGNVGKGLTYLITVIILGLIGWGIYEFVHLFTMTQFIEFLKFAGFIILIIALCVGMTILVMYINDKWVCNSRLNKIVFWKYVGGFFVIIGKGFAITFDMIVNLYKQNCPMIHWKDGE